MCEGDPLFCLSLSFIPLDLLLPLLLLQLDHELVLEETLKSRLEMMQQCSLISEISGARN